MVKLSKQYLWKKPNSLNYPILRGLSRIFLVTLWKYNIFSLVFFFVKIWQCLTLCSSHSKRIINARCKIKSICSDIILCSWNIREKTKHFREKNQRPKNHLDRLYGHLIEIRIKTFMWNKSFLFLNVSTLQLLILN